MKYSVLIIEDTTDLWRSMIRALRATQMPFHVQCATGYIEAIEKISQESFDLIICDYFLPDLRNGLEVWKYCRIKCSITPFLLISGMHADQYLDHIAGMKNYPPFLSKPFSIYELKEVIEALLFDQNGFSKVA